MKHQTKIGLALAIVAALAYVQKVPAMETDRCWSCGGQKLPFYVDVAGEQVASGYKWREEKTRAAPKVKVPRTQPAPRSGYRWKAKPQSRFNQRKGGGPGVGGNRSKKTNSQ